jgi:magnesium-transporting ATPase (P-type)
MSEEELKREVLLCNVYARASPDNKIRIVKALQSNGQIVSMTGDGVNDAPSLKAANIGVAMGITGTDVSKEAAKIVLQDDNFGTIVEAVREGRRVWDNLRKVFLFNLPTNFAQGMVVFFSFVLGMHEAPLTPIQVLYVNMIISVTFGGALSFEVEERGLMQRKPRRASEPLISAPILFRTFYATAVMVIGIIGVFQWSLSLGNSVGQARAAAFTLLVISSIFYCLNCRSTTEFALGPSLLRPNSAFWASVVGVSTLQAIIVHVAPINQFFSCETADVAKGHCHPLGQLEWGVILAVAVFIFLLVELEKAFVLPHIMNADWHLPHIFHHVEGEEGKWSFLATSASFHGVSHLKSTHAPAADASRGNFSTRNLAAKLQSKRSLGSTSGGGGAPAGAGAQLEVRAPL